MDSLVIGAALRSLGKEEELPDAAADLDDDEADDNDIEHEQIYYLLADAYPDKFEDAQDAKETIHEALDFDEEEKGVDDEEDREEESEDFNPGNTPDNLDQHPYDEEEWQEDYDAEYGDEKNCGHTNHKGEPLNEEDCPMCDEGDDDV